MYIYMLIYIYLYAHLAYIYSIHIHLPHIPSSQLQVAQRRQREAQGVRLGQQEGSGPVHKLQRAERYTYTTPRRA